MKLSMLFFVAIATLCVALHMGLLTQSAPSKPILSFLHQQKKFPNTVFGPAPPHQPLDKTKQMINRNNNNNNNLDETYYPYVLAMMRRRKGEERITLHGLWPNYADQAVNEFCDWPEVFNVTNFEPLLPEINNFWAGFDKEYTLLRHEVEKHGSCYCKRHRVPHLAFVQKTLDLFHQYVEKCDNMQTKDCRCNFDEKFNLLHCVQK